ncbi:MAG TPA: trypsin-like peptidase domain-containing protein, partial [Solirubrobacteraceae bacterium]|nr:trypsin-like peptidase domain-containing protein [Solirubrobacteraceae bacterium]
PIIGGAIAGGVIALIIASSSTSTKTVTTTVVQQGSSSTSAEPTSFKSGTGLSINQIYKAASPGVVDIKVTAQSSNQGFGFFGGGQSGVTEGEGAGVVYNTKGDILTDEHVVANATSVQVNFQDGKSVPAKVVGTDPSTDVAVIHVEVPTSELHPIPLADSSQAQVGDPVVAIGSPFSLPETTTTGIVSQTGRSIQAPNQYTIPDAIQTDAAINPGNSGGPLLDADGHVLGLNDQIETNNQTAGGEGSSSGVGFAVPSDTVKQVADEIIAGHKVEHSFVGVSLPAGGGSSAKILQIKSNSPASRADLQVGDVVSAINGTPITTSDAFIATIDKYKPGQKVTLSIQRSGQTKQIQVTLAQRPAQTPSGG